jgi:hypothetical protein
LLLLHGMAQLLLVLLEHAASLSQLLPVGLQ